MAELIDLSKSHFLGERPTNNEAQAIAHGVREPNTPFALVDEENSRVLSLRELLREELSCMCNQSEKHFAWCVDRSKNLRRKHNFFFSVS